MPKDASDTTQRRKQRVLFADRVVQDTTFTNKGKNYILLEGNINHKAPLTYSPHYYNMINGAVETTPEELESYIASVPGGETVPGVPTNVSAVAGDQEATITFNPPSSNGGNSITSYTVTSNPGGFTASGSGSPLTVTGLTNGTAYTFTVVATNGVGNSSPSAASNSVTPLTTPDAPTSLVGTTGNTQVQIAFTVGSDGGAAITNYEYSTDDGSTWQVFSPAVTSSPVTITGLTNGTPYKVQLRAVNSVGSGAASSSLRITPVPFSGLMMLLDAATYEAGSIWYDYSGKQMHATLVNSPTWNSANGGRYEFNGTDQYAQVPSGFANFTSGITVLAIADLGFASSWERIIDFGNGPESNNIVFARNGTTTNLEFHIYNGSTGALLRSLTSGISNNAWNFYGARADGSNYKILNLASSSSDTSAVLPLNVTRTSNYIGKSNWNGNALFEGYMGVLAIFNTALSDSEITAFLDMYRSRYLPSPPTDLGATAGNAEATITFTAGSDNGTPITNYKYSTDGVNYTALSPADATSPITITGLTNGTTYNITLKAVNAFGDSVASTSVSVTPESNETIVQFKTTGTTTWVAPAGVSSISYFIVGGGGGGGGSYDGGAGGGGGGGLVLSGTRAVTAGQSYTVVVGAGGAGGVGVTLVGDGLATAGGDSSFDTIVAKGGGIGYGSLDDRSGVGGSQGDDDTLTAPTGGKGGRSPQNGFGAGGGGGMSAAGATAVSATNAAGGAGIFSNITGTTVQYGKGGNGGRIQINANGTSATANTGNGGNGAGSTFADGSTGGAGGSGIVVIVYEKPVVSGSPRVLIIGDSNAASLPAQLELAKADLGYEGTMTFTTKNVFGTDSAYTGSDITTENYDVVILYTNGGATPQTTLGNNISAYVESGGNLIMGVFAWGNVTPFPGLNYSLVSPYAYSGSQSSDGGAITKVVDHPIFTGIDNTIGISVNCTPSISLASGAVGIGKFPSNNWFLAVKEYSPIKMVGINGYFAFQVWSGGNDQKNILRYVVNSIYWCNGSL